MTTPPDYVAYTPFGAVLIAFPDGEPTEYEGPADAIEHLHRRIARVTGTHGGLPLSPAGLNPNDAPMLASEADFIAIERTPFNPAPAEGTP